MPNEVRFRVEAEVILVPSLARLLMVFNALHVAAALTNESQGEELAAKLRSSGTIAMASELLSEAFDTGIFNDSALFRALAALNTIDVGELVLPLRLSELHSGSIEGVIEEIIESIFGRFKALLSTLPGIATGEHNSLNNLVQEMMPLASDQTAFGDIVQVAAFNAQFAFKSMQTTAMTVSEKAVQYNTMT